MRDGIELATGPVSWGVDFADSPRNPPWEVVLDEIAASGLSALELGPVGYLPEDPATLREALNGRALTAVGSFIFDDLHDPASAARILTEAERVARAIAAAEGRVMVIIDRPAGVRLASAGRAAVAPRMDAADWGQMVARIEAVAAIASNHGLRPAFHPHAGSWVEFGDEVDRLLADTDLDLCLDLGHAAIAGVAAADALERWGARLEHVHLKDVDGAVLERVRLQGLSFWEAIEAGVFCPLGEGVVDFGAAASCLAAIGYRGFATVEQDRVPGSGEPLADLGDSLAVLERAGFATGKPEAR